MFGYLDKPLVMFALAVNITLATSVLQAETLSDALGDTRAKLFAYFRNQPAAILPIFVPAGEQTGDVYRDAFGGYFSRRSNCFPNLRVSRANSRLVGVINTNAKAASGEIGGKITELAAAGVNAGWKMADSVEIKYSDVTVDVSSDLELRNAFQTKVSGCAPIGKLMSAPDKDNRALVLGQVFVGKQLIETTVTRSLSGQAGGEVTTERLTEKLQSMNAALGKIGMLLETKAKIEFKGNNEAYAKVRFIDDKALPIGYRPAFLSQQHLQLILGQAKNGTFEAIESDVLKNKDSAATAKKYSEVIVSPTGLLTAMASGKLIPFNPENKEHDMYLKGVGLIFAIGTDAGLK